MTYLIDLFLKPGAVVASELANLVPGRHYSAEFWHFTFDHELNGVIDAQGEDDDDRWRLVVTGNAVTSGDSSRGAVCAAATIRAPGTLVGLSQGVAGRDL